MPPIRTTRGRGNQRGVSGACYLSIMSLAIDVDDVTSVLLADGWHKVPNKSFNLDSFEFLWAGDLIYGGGGSGVCATGFSFESEDGTISGPLTAVLAVKT